MSITKQVMSSRKMVVSIVTAFSLMVVLTAAVSANSQKAVWDGVGLVTYAGGSVTPPTSTESEFKFNHDGSVKSVEIETTNELVIGVLGDTAGGAEITDCKDRKKGNACDELGPLLDGATVTSLHNSTAKLRNVTQGSIDQIFPYPVPVLSGDVRGKLEGVVSLSNSTGGQAIGTASLRIGKGSTATYACFGPTPFGFVPLPSLDSCTDNTGGMLMPLFLNVQDKGKFEIGQGTGSMSAIESMEGKVEVSVMASPFDTDGAILISKAKTTLAGD